MNTLKRRFVRFFVLTALVMLGSVLVAQGPPNSCYDGCLQAYKAAVAACKGDAGCVAAARASAQACVSTCK
jgi:hypothetical protein